MTELARKLGIGDYFTLSWGTMVGVGWLVVMDDWLGRGGSVGAILGFVLGGALLIPIGYVYGQLVKAIPDAAAEIAYTALVFPRSLSYATGWMMMLAYFIVCPWEAVALGKIAGYIFPALDRWQLYRVAGKPVYLPHLLLGVGLIALLTTLNYRGIRLSANFQDWTALGTIALFLTFVIFGAAHGSLNHFQPVFSSQGRFVSVFLVLQIVPYFMTGFESVAKVAEEANPDFPRQGFLLSMIMAIGGGVLFYSLVIAAVAYAAPWWTLRNEPLMTAVAFERAVGSRWIVNVILTAALLSLLKVFNGNFVASSRLLFALGRRHLVDGRFATVHAVNHTPSTAVLWVGIVSGVCMLLGPAILVPVAEVGSLASALGWAAACAAYYAMRPTPGKQTIAALGFLFALVMILMKVMPIVPGHFSAYEWIALAFWIAAGWACRQSERLTPSTVKVPE